MKPITEAELLEDMRSLTVRMQYPYSAEYEYTTEVERINLNEERETDIFSGNGFIITRAQNIKKDLKSNESIFSSRFGPTLDDLGKCETRYSCRCKHTTGSLSDGIICEVCHTEVKYVSDNFEYFGWITIKEPYAIIHPNIYKSLVSLIGKKILEEILDPTEELDENGNVKVSKPPTKDNPFPRIGLIEFKKRTMEILDYFVARRKPDKREFYDDIVRDIDKIWTNSIPVYTTQLRPFKLDGTNFSFEGNNATYNILAGQACRINNKVLRTEDSVSERIYKELLYSMQTNYNLLYDDMISLLSNKKGYTRTLLSGKFNYSSRCVIVLNPKLNIDEIILPYNSLVEMLQLKIINILSKTNSPSRAYKIWENSRSVFSQVVYDIIVSICNNEYVGILFGRNPSLITENIRQMRVVGVNRHYSCSIPLEILRGYNADFDGDSMYSIYIIDKNLLVNCMRIYNPRYAGQLSRNDGLFNSNVSLQKDTMICLNSFGFMHRKKYSEDKLERIKKAMEAEEK